MPMVEAVLTERLFSRLYGEAKSKYGSTPGFPGRGEFKDLQDFCKAISEEVIAEVRRATIIVPPGQMVATAGTAFAQAGSTVSPSPPANVL
jgi:hypothetical protein